MPPPREGSRCVSPIPAVCPHPRGVCGPRHVSPSPCNPLPVGAPFPTPAPRCLPPVRPEPVVALEGLVPQQQIAEAVPGRQGQHLGLQLRHLQGGDVQNDPALAALAAVPAAAAAGRREPAGKKGAVAMGGRGGGDRDEGQGRPALPCPPPPPAPAPAPPPGLAPRNPHPGTHRPVLPRTAAPPRRENLSVPTAPTLKCNYIVGQAAVPPLKRAPLGGMGGEGLGSPQERGRRSGHGAEPGPPERPAARCTQDICSSAGKQQGARGANGTA